MLHQIPRLFPSIPTRRWFIRFFSLLLASLILLGTSACDPVQPGSTTAAGSESSTTVRTENLSGSQTESSSGPDESSQTASAGESTTQALAGVVLIDPDEALDLMAREPDSLLVDVRTAEEYQTGYIEGAILLPVDEIAGRLAELPENKDTPIIIYCRSGRRSAIAAGMILEAGYTRVYDLGGILSWPYDLVID